MPKNIIAIALGSLVAFYSASDAAARDQIHIVGSGTAYPFVTTAAEEFGEGGKFKTPIVEATGTGGGFKLFCEGTGKEKPDINDASRRMTDSEKENCAKNGVTGSIELPIGFDGIVIASKTNGALPALSKKQIFLALARELPDSSGALAKNPNETWRDVDASLPAQPIRIYGPGTVSGTRDTFAELVMKQGCEEAGALAKAYADKAAREKVCGLIREDGKYIESGEDYNILVQKLTADAQALGIFGYGFYEQNKARIQAAAIDGVAPSEESIVTGKYGISRRLYVYVKRQHIGLVPGIVEFLRELTSDNAIGPEGYVTAKGLLALPDKERKAARETVARLK